MRRYSDGFRPPTKRRRRPDREGRDGHDRTRSEIAAFQGLLGRSAKMLINGELVGPVSGKTFEVVNPATGAVITNVPQADKADVDIGVAAARRAFDNGVWARVSPSEKRRMLWRIADLIELDLEESAEVEAIDNGKPYSIARVADLPLAVDMFRYMVGWATKISGRTIPWSGLANISAPRSRSRSALSA